MFAGIIYNQILQNNFMEPKATELLKENQAKNTEGETVSELVHRHLKDEKHVITDDEIRNAKLEVYNLEEPEGDFIDTKDKAAKEAEVFSPEEKDIIATPFDILK